MIFSWFGYRSKPVVSIPNISVPMPMSELKYFLEHSPLKGVHPSWPELRDYGELRYLYWQHRNQRNHYHADVIATWRNTAFERIPLEIREWWGCA